ncbi:ladderlectin-like isoform X1 [Oreochromis niloticus]|uniref:Ladderlectin-like n=2 Tax=Oreochromis TaxID=8139 RepID=I3K9E5_ORENI|nr:ladderlectin-like isoform X1 [Oreochromis niloticus]XP_031592032.2 ladderlectin-like [Oreochromis aureus]
MKLLTVSALLCIVMVVTIGAGEHLVYKKHWYLGWSRYGNRYFRYFPFRYTWAEAQRYCQLKKANLASVRSLGEYRKIQRVIYRSTHSYPVTWIGGSDAQQERYWFWIDGTPFTYTYWCRGEPNNVWHREHCMHMNWTGRKCMNDKPCNYRYPFVCVRKRR